jgi:hypothetical protein
LDPAQGQHKDGRQLENQLSPTGLDVPVDESAEVPCSRRIRRRSVPVHSLCRYPTSDAAHDSCCCPKTRRSKYRITILDQHALFHVKHYTAGYRCQRGVNAVAGASRDQTGPSRKSPVPTPCRCDPLPHEVLYCPLPRQTGAHPASPTTCRPMQFCRSRSSSSNHRCAALTSG